MADVAQNDRVPIPDGVEMDPIDIPLQIANSPPQAVAPQPTPQAQQNPNTQFGMVRDRLFHAMLIKIALGYSGRVNLFWRRILEFFVLLSAMMSLCTLLFVHVMFTRSSTTCLSHIKDTWPRQGVVRLEVVHNLKMLEYRERWLDWYQKNSRERSRIQQCQFNIQDVLLYGPAAIPAEIRANGYRAKTKQEPQRVTIKEETSTRPSQSEQKEHHIDQQEDAALLSYFIKSPLELLDGLERTQPRVKKSENMTIGRVVENKDDVHLYNAERAYEEHFRSIYTPDDDFSYAYKAEFSLLYGVLRLPIPFRIQHNITTLWVRIDSENECLGDGLTRKVMRHLMGYEDGVMGSLRMLTQLANTTDDAKMPGGLGYLHDLSTNEHFHFVSNTMTKWGYVGAAVIMFIFTFVISMLLRFSHHQIFMFIVDLLHMFELNQPLVFPATPLFTIILALVGMEAIMSEVFADTSTAFYVIIVVWLADQYDAICCHSPISKRYWLRFFYLYQFIFYAYQYRLGGQYGSIALVTSAIFILHSMLFFFHHYEIPLIMYQDRLQTILNEIHTAPQQHQHTQAGEGMASNNRPSQLIPPEAQGNTRSENEPNLQPEQQPVQLMSPSSVFDGRQGIPPHQQHQTAEEAALPDVSSTSQNPMEQFANEVVTEVIEELFQA